MRKSRAVSVVGFVFLNTLRLYVRPGKAGRSVATGVLNESEVTRVFFFTMYLLV